MPSSALRCRRSDSPLLSVGTKFYCNAVYGGINVTLNSTEYRRFVSLMQIWTTEYGNRISYFFRALLYSTFVKIGKAGSLRPFRAGEFPGLGEDLYRIRWLQEGQAAPSGQAWRARQS